MNPHDIVAEFERQVADYAGAAHGVAVNSCTSALTLSVKYAFLQGGCTGKVWIPKHTYVGVAYAILAAGGEVAFKDHDWEGAYQLGIHRHIDGVGVAVVDSARRFTRDMFRPQPGAHITLWCVSFHETKILPIGDGGMILTDSPEAASRLRRMRFDGRTPGRSVFDDDFTEPWALHCNMKPPLAARGLMLMAGLKDDNQDLPGNYPDLSMSLKGVENVHC